MSRTPLKSQLLKMIRIAQFANQNKISSKEALERFAEKTQLQKSRRKLIKSAGTLALGSALLPYQKIFAAPRPPQIDVGIVGAGLAGIVCAHELKKAGLLATVYEASNRAGGRCHTLRNFFPGQVAERGGELIDNLHKTMLGYANEFGLTIENIFRNEGEEFYYFNGQHHSNEAVVEEMRIFVEASRTDMRYSSGGPTFRNHTDYDVTLDTTSLEEYLQGANALGMTAGPIAYQAIKQAYLAEYGLELSEQSALNYLMFIHHDRRSKFKPFGVFSDERYHVAEGNDRIVQGLMNSVANQIQYNLKLVRVRKTAAGRIELTFRDGNRTLTKTHDAAVLSIPFSVLREVELDPNLNISDVKRQAINELGYGNNAKMMIGFDGRPWKDLGSNGASYSNLANHQATWETNYTLANNSRGILTDYSSGQRGLSLNPSRAQQEAAAFLTDLDKVYPGAKAKATRTNGNYRVHLEHWPSKSTHKGSYTCYKPGQFTGIAEEEGRTEGGNLFFAGEHANSFYVWQGFMEGACLSGIDAASAILRG